MTREEFLYQAQQIANQAATNASQLNFGQSLKQELLNSSEQIQNILDSVFSTTGVLSTTQEVQLDEKMRLAKKAILESEYKITIQKYAVIGSITVVSLGIFWYLTRK